MTKELIIFGAAEAATLSRYYFEHDGGRNALAFVVDDEYVREDSVEGLPVVPWSEVLSRFDPARYEMFVAISFSGMNVNRQRKFEACRKAGYSLASYISSKSTVWPDLVHGENCLILEHNTIQPTVRIGSNVIAWNANSLGHASVIKDHVYIAANVSVAGHCEIGERCFLGIGSAVKDGCKIGADTFVTMGALVTRDLPASSVILAAPSTVADKATAAFVRNSYFGLS